MDLDVLAFAAHPDDVELAMGGTVAKLVKQGYKVGIVDCSKGEMGTRGTEQTRAAEAAKAAEILGVSVRDNLGLPDGSIKLNDKFTKAVVTKIRQYKPKMIFAPYFNDRHPDHGGTSQIVKEAFFYSGLTKLITTLDGEEQKPYRPQRIYYYMQYYEFVPSFIYDISETFETKMDSLRAYGTQFFKENDESKEPQTFISQLNFIKYIEARCRYYGFKIGKDFGEAFFTEEEVELDLTHFLK